MKSDVPLRMLAGHCTRLIKNLDITVHDLHKPLNSRHTALKLLRKLDDPADRSDQRAHIHHICHQIPRHDLAPDHEKTTGHQQHQIHYPVKCPCRRMESRHKLVSFLLDTEKINIVLLEFRFFLLFVGKSFHHLLPQQTVLNAGIELTNLYTLFAERFPHTQIDHRACHHHHRYHRKKDQCQSKADPRQDHERNDRLDTRDKKLLRAVMGELCHIKQIIRDPPHDLAYLRVIIVSIRQLLQMGVSVPPHVRLNACSHHMTGVRHIEIGHRIYDPQDQVQRPKPQYHRHRE